MRQISCRATQDTKIVNSVFPASVGESKTIALLARNRQLLAAFEIFEKYNVVFYSFRVQKEQADTVRMRMHVISRSNNT
jgi:limonene-1,2-epoxide hydrolase